MINNWLSGSRNLWLTRLYFLIYYIGMGAVDPFINLYYVERHLSGTQIGLIGTLCAVSALIAAPLWGRVSDNSRHPKRWLQAAMLISGLALFLLSQQTIFLFLAFFAGLNALVGPGVDPLMSAQAMDVVEAEKSAGFGSIRLWGSLGYALAAPLGGWVIQEVGISKAFYIYAAGMVLSAFILIFVLMKPRLKSISFEVVETVKTASALEVAKGVWKNRELMGLIVASVVLWGLGGGTRFEAVYLTQLGVEASVIGWLNTVGAIIELPMMLLTDRVLRRKGSAYTVKLAFWLTAFSFIFVVAYPTLVSFFLFRLVGGIAYSFMCVLLLYSLWNAHRLSKARHCWLFTPSQWPELPAWFSRL
jgi:PPP family 3-phenylpropionic acid transporter